MKHKRLKKGEAILISCAKSLGIQRNYGEVSKYYIIKYDRNGKFRRTSKYFSSKKDAIAYIATLPKKNPPKKHKKISKSNPAKTKTNPPKSANSPLKKGQVAMVSPTKKLGVQRNYGKVSQYHVVKILKNGKPKRTGKSFRVKKEAVSHIRKKKK